MRRLIKWYLFLFLLLVFAGCGGSNATPTITPSPVVTGVAAAGSPLVGRVFLKDSSIPAKELSMPLATDGSFQFNLDGLTAPFILRAVGKSSGHFFALYSFAPTSGIANINPLSNLAVTLAYGSDNLASLYTSADAVSMQTITRSLGYAIKIVQTVLYPTLVKFGAETVDFIFAPYAANHNGIDLFLDNATISTGQGTIFLVDRTTDSVVQTTLDGFIAGSFDFIPNPVKVAGTVCISPLLGPIMANVSPTLRAHIIGAEDQSVIWSVVEEGGGSITSSGVYTAPATSGTYHVRATSTADPARSATMPIEVRGANYTYIIPTAISGEYSVMAENFSGIGGIEVTITYDTSVLASPRLTQGALLAGAMFISNPKYSADSVKFTALSFSAINGSGSLATIKFGVAGNAPDILRISAQKIVSIPPPISLSPPISVVSGDVDGDGVVRLADPLMVMRNTIGTYSLTQSQLSICDVTGGINSVMSPDGVCDVADAVMILNKAYGLITF